MYQTVVASPLGPLTLLGEEDALCALGFGDLGGDDKTPLFQEAQRELEEYFDGTRRSFDLPLRPEGSAFQQRVWLQLRKIPYGTTLSYRELAGWADCPKGFQAVGQANRRNPLPILIPCHRVIAANGSLGGYSGGMWRKRFLLRLEGAALPSNKT